jgi:hypothetical protein
MCGQIRDASEADRPVSVHHSGPSAYVGVAASRLAQSCWIPRLMESQVDLQNVSFLGMGFLISGDRWAECPLGNRTASASYGVTLFLPVAALRSWWLVSPIDRNQVRCLVCLGGTW